MRSITFFSILLIFIGCVTSKNSTTKKLNGAWSTVKLEIAGKDLPPASFQNQKLELHDSSYIYTAESVDKGIVKYNAEKLDIYGKDGVNAGKHFTAIYKFENELLVICYNLAGDSYPVAFETKSKPTLFMAHFKRQ